MNRITAPLSKKISRPFFLLALFLFTFVSVAGLYACTGLSVINNMESGHSMEMEDCIDGSVSPHCQMNMNDHTEGWQSLVLFALPSNLLSLLLSTLVVGCLVLVILLAKYLVETAPVFLRLYIRSHPNIRHYNYFSELFSSGILQPKLFA